MKTRLFPMVPAMAVTILLSALASAAPVYTNTDQPDLAPIEETSGPTDIEQPNAASPTGAVKNMAPVRGTPLKVEAISPGESASGLTLPGAASGSSLGSGSNSTLAPTTQPAVTTERPDIFED